MRHPLDSATVRTVAGTLASPEVRHEKPFVAHCDGFGDDRVRRGHDDYDAGDDNGNDDGTPCGPGCWNRFVRTRF